MLSPDVGTPAKCCGRCSSGYSDHGASLEAEILILREGIIVLRRTAPKRLSFNGLDRLYLLVSIGCFRTCEMHLRSSGPKRSSAGTVPGSEPIGVGGRCLAGDDRRSVPRLEVRGLIREMSLANPLWGAPRIDGELLKLGIAIGVDERGQIHDPGEEVEHRHRAGGQFPCVTMRTALLRWTCSWCRRFRSGFSMEFLFWRTSGGGSFGWGPRRIQPRSGSLWQLTEACGWNAGWTLSHP